MGINKNPYVPVIAPPALSMYAHDKNMRPSTFKGWRQILAYQTFHQLYSCAHYVFTAWVDAKTKAAYKHKDLDWYLLRHYQMPNWYQTILVELFKNRTVNEGTIRRYVGMTRPEWNAPTTEVAKYLQYKGVTVRGCPWKDTGFSLDLCEVRGSQMVLAMGMVLDKQGKDDPAKRQVHSYILGQIIEALVTPGGYKEACNRLRLQIAGTLALISWDSAAVSNVTNEMVYRRMAQMGVTLAAVDDAYYFALQWILDCEENRSKEWTTERVQTVLATARTGSKPARINPANVEFFLRPVDLPWKTTIDNDAQFRSVWKQELRVPCSKGWVHGPDYHAYVRELGSTNGISTGADTMKKPRLMTKPSPSKSLISRMSAPAHVNAYRGNLIIPPSTIPGKPPIVDESSPRPEEFPIETSMDVDDHQEDQRNEEAESVDQTDDAADDSMEVGEISSSQDVDVHNQTEDENYEEYWEVIYFPHRRSTTLSCRLRRKCSGA
jgi:hypothetical protein